MKTKIVLLAVFLASGCATALPPKEVRTVQYIEPVKATKAQGYNRALAELSKALGDANKAIQSKNPDDGRIIAKINVKCNVLRQWGDVKDYFIKLDLDFTARENKIKFVFEDMSMISEDGLPTTWAYNQLGTIENIEKVKPCLAEFKEKVKAAVNASADF